MRCMQQATLFHVGQQQHWSELQVRSERTYIQLPQLSNNYPVIDLFFELRFGPESDLIHYGFGGDKSLFLTQKKQLKKENVRSVLPSTTFNIHSIARRRAGEPSHTQGKQGRASTNGRVSSGRIYVRSYDVIV